MKETPLECVLLAIMFIVFLIIILMLPDFIM